MQVGCGQSSHFCLRSGLQVDMDLLILFGYIMDPLKGHIKGGGSCVQIKVSSEHPEILLMHIKVSGVHMNVFCCLMLKQCSLIGTSGRNFSIVCLAAVNF